MMSTEVSSDFDVNEAAANAKKLALSTNTAPAWTNPFAFDYYSQIPPPTFYPSSQLGSGGLNFMTTANSSFAPPPIPQLSVPPPSPQRAFTRHTLSPRPSHPYHPPPPFYNNFSHPPPNYSHPPRSNAPWEVGKGGEEEIVERVSRNNTDAIGPKPIRFSLNPTGRKHIFNPNQNNSHQGGFNSGIRGPGSGAGKPNSRFGPPVNQPVNGTVKDLFSVEIAKPESLNVSPTKNTPGYGLTNGSSWASSSTPAPSAGNKNGTVAPQNAAIASTRSRLQSADFASCINSDNWPPSLKKYAEKWFTIVMAGDPGDIDKAQDLLREKMEEAYIAGDFKTRDWMLEDLPVLPSSHALHTGLNAAAAPIPGTVKGTPLKVDSFPVVGRGRGRGRSSPARSESFKNRQQGRPKGIRGRNRFRSRSTSRSWSRSRSRSSSSSSENRSKKRKRHDSGSKSKKNEKKFAKKEKAKNKKQKGKNKAHIYSEFGSVGGQVTEISSARLDARAARFAKDEAKAPTVSMKSRLGGFVNNSNLTPVKWGLDRDPSAAGRNDRRVLPSWDMNSKIVGTSTELEKMYLRLTTAVDPSTIRPVHILRRSLAMVCEKWKKNEDYRYTCDQLKSIRQDLTVQRVRDPFTVLVYETHARIALEKGDHEEFNQCQSQLVQLYSTLPNAQQNQKEFTAYRILYYIFTTSTLDLGTVMAKLTDDERQDECISHALQVRSAWAIGNYYEFFKLHKVAPKMSAYLIDWFVNRERKNALRKILKAYRPVVPKSFVQSQLDLTEEGWKNFVKVSQLETVIIYTDGPSNTKMNARDSYAALIAALGVS